MPNFLINTDIKLQNIITNLKDSSVIGLDTEFIRESTYYPQLALLQLSDNYNNYCIDILEIQDNQPIADLLGNEDIIKVIHSSKQDLEVLYHYFGCYPINLFDTQIAYNLLSPEISISYSNLVKKYCNIELKEGSWRTDWLKRPLSDEKIEYAANDVKYLIKLYEILKNELILNDRLDWFMEEQIIDLKMSNIITDPELSWKKINLPSNLQSSQLDNIKILSKWREQKAIENNLPKRWIFSDSELIKIVTAKTDKLDYVLKNIKYSPNTEDENFIKSIIGLKCNEEMISKKSMDPSLYNLRASKCQKTLEEVCLKYNIASTLIANKRELDSYARGNMNVKFLSGWRFKIFGKLVQ